MAGDDAELTVAPDAAESSVIIQRCAAPVNLAFGHAFGFIAMNSSINRVRTIAAWAAIPCFVCVVVSEQTIAHMNPVGNGPWPSAFPRPKLFDVMLQIRNFSILLALMAGFISLPRWQSFVGLGLTITYLAYTYIVFVHY